jgi:epsilon-lactone hydrolase
MSLIPIDDADIPAARALRVEFARFWSTERGDPRAVYDRFVAETPVAAGVDVTPATTDPAPGVWVRPTGAAPERIVLFLHGGGYGLGSTAAYVGLVSQLAVRAGVACFALEYPLAPEARLPDALDLAVASLSGLAGQYSAVAVAGDSAGGGLALATLARARRDGVDVAAAAVFSPWTDLGLRGESVRRNAVADPILDPAYLRRSAAAYLGSAPADDPRASPLYGDVAELPPLLIQVGSDEVLLDDSRRFADAAARAGAPVTLEEWQGMHHVFHFNVAELAAARDALDRAARFLSAHLRDAVADGPLTRAARR